MTKKQMFCDVCGAEDGEGRHVVQQRFSFDQLSLDETADLCLRCFFDIRAKLRETYKQATKRHNQPSIKLGE
jgi:hypothetical protein